MERGEKQGNLLQGQILRVALELIVEIFLVFIHLAIYKRLHLHVCWGELYRYTDGSSV